MSNPISFFTVSQIQQFIDEGRIFIKPELFKVGQISDGHHTFDELYEHRIALFKALSKYTSEGNGGFVWKTKKYHDGHPVDEGWFIAGMDDCPGSIITYHVPMSEWDSWPAKEIPVSHYDGHQSADVLKRLAEL